MSRISGDAATWSIFNEIEVRARRRPTMIIVKEEAKKNIYIYTYMHTHLNSIGGI
jgi:hypothetical protein